MVDENQIPESSLCPLTQEIMEDPVVAADGHTYEYNAIILWLERHNISPITGEPIRHKDLIENYRLRSTITQFKDRQHLLEASSRNQKQPIDASSHTEELNKIISYIRKTISKKKDYIDRIRISIIILYDIKEDLESNLLGCKISNTAGNSASIAGTGLLFTPLAWLGVGALVAGGLTSIGTAMIQSRIENNKLQKMKEILIEEEKAAICYGASEIRVQYLIENASFMVDERLKQIARQMHTFQNIRAANVNPDPSYRAEALGSGLGIVSKVGKLSKFLATAGIVVSSIDIVMTWKMNNSTLEQVKNEIELKERIIETQMRELQDLENSIA